MSESLLNQELSTQALCGLVADLLCQNGWMLATAESCTGGMIAATCTDLAGSSVWFERGFVTYSNAAKTELLGVDASLIAQHGAVSEPMVRAMAAELALWFPQHAQSMDAALALHLRRVGYDAATGVVGAPNALPEGLIHGCGGASCSDEGSHAPAAGAAEPALA